MRTGVRNILRSPIDVSCIPFPGDVRCTEQCRCLPDGTVEPMGGRKLSCFLGILCIVQ